MPHAETRASTWDASAYARNSSEQQRWAREFFPKLGLTGSERLLDLGCGDGKITVEFAAALPTGSVLGVDRSPEMVTHARRAYLPERFPNLHFEQADASHLSFRTEFDMVFSNAVLHWVLDHRPVLAGIAAALRPSGRAVLLMGGRGTAAGIFSALEAVTASERWLRHFADFVFPFGYHGPEEYADWLRVAGLQPSRVELVPKEFVLTGGEGLTAWIESTWLPYVQRVPESVRRAFAEEVAERYLADHPLESQGRVRVSMLRLEVEAHKPYP